MKQIKMAQNIIQLQNFVYITLYLVFYLVASELCKHSTKFVCECNR